MPFTPSGKIDRVRLLAHLDDVRNQQASSSRSLSERELTVARIFSEVLRVPVTSPAADFYLLGGSSLLALRVAGMLRQAGLAVRATELFEWSSVEQIAAHVAHDGSSR